VLCSGKVLDPGFPLPSMAGIPEAPLKSATALVASLNQLDVHSFLYATTYVAGYQEEGATERPLLPPHLAPPLTTTVQVTVLLNPCHIQWCGSASKNCACGSRKKSQCGCGSGCGCRCGFMTLLNYSEPSNSLRNL
jgi:hypothetical protein